MCTCNLLLSNLHRLHSTSTPRIGKLVNAHRSAPRSGLVRGDDSTIQCPGIVEFELYDAVIIRIAHRLLTCQGAVFMLT